MKSYVIFPCPTWDTKYPFVQNTRAAPDGDFAVIQVSAKVSLSGITACAPVTLAVLNDGTR